MNSVPARQKIALALGGGGARGLAHVGVLRALEREGIPIDGIAGTSMGGLVGALYAAGVPLDTVEAELDRLSNVKEQMRLVDVSISAAGLSVRGRRVYNFMADLVGEDLTFADLRLPLVMVAVDIRTGRPVLLQGGLVIDAVRATISVPGVFMPVDLGDFRLVDGGVLDNVPVDVARGMGASHGLGAPRVIAVDVLPSFSDNTPGQEPASIGLQLPFAPLQLNETYHVLMIMIAALTESRLREYPPDLLIRPVLPPDITLLTGFNRAAEIVAAGEAATVAALPAIRALLRGEEEEGE